METTQTLIQEIYASVGDANTGDAPEGLGKHIVEECLEVLKEPEKSKAKPAIKVLAALVKTTRQFKPGSRNLSIYTICIHFTSLYHPLHYFTNYPTSHPTLP